MHVFDSFVYVPANYISIKAKDGATGTRYVASDPNISKIIIFHKHLGGKI